MMADTRFINATNDLAAIRANLRDAHEARRRGDLRAAVTAQEQALLPLARLMAEAQAEAAHRDRALEFAAGRSREVVRRSTPHPATTSVTHH